MSLYDCETVTPSLESSIEGKLLFSPFSLTGEDGAKLGTHFTMIDFDVAMIWKCTRCGAINYGLGCTCRICGEKNDDTH